MMAAYTNYRRDPRVRREAEALVEAGWQVEFLASRQPGEPDRETIDGVNIIKVPKLNQRRTSMAFYLLDYALFLLWSMAYLCSRPLRYRLIHINNMPDFLVFAAWLPRALGVPVIHDVHDLMPELFEEKFAARKHRWVVRIIRAQERWAGRFASALLTVEERLKDVLAARGVPRDKIHVLMNLPDERIFVPRQAAPVKAADAPFVLVYHGTLARRLGLDIAIRAVALARAQVPSIVLRIIGAGEERDTLIALRNELGLTDIVTFSDGFVSVQAVPALIADADAGIVPLRMCSGTDIMLPTKLLEYVAMGIPCIAPKTGTIARYFDESMLQFFEAENCESLTGAIVELHRDPGRRSAMASQATRRFAEPYQWRTHKRVYTDLVGRLTASALDVSSDPMSTRKTP
jgi:glycosyltransferase involved in cell wall biosynthesis